MRILFCIWVIFTAFVNVAKGADPILAIKLNNEAAIQYCTDPVLVANNLSIEGNFSITGMKISFSEGYKAGEDELAYSGSINHITGIWFAAQGFYLLKGDANSTAENYQDAIKLVTYKNIKPIPIPGNRKISITLEDADYLPETGHFYRFVEKSNLSWKNAKAEAELAKYYDLKGYLATITSQGENDFIKLKTKGVGWIGASDESAEGVWRWVTGPEGLEDEGKGRIFYNSGSYNGQYSNWNSGEPNNVGTGGEHYAHITVFPNNAASSYKWNDLPDIGGNGDYASKGYLIEFGGFPEEPKLELSATLELQVNTLLFNTGTIAPICEGESFMLNMADLNAIPATYTWTPDETLSSPSVANPYATPKVTTTYTVAGTRGECNSTATYTVPVNPKPISLLNPEENICTGDMKTLDPGSNQDFTYLWNNGATTQTITVDVTGDYSVTITTDKGCTAPPFITKVVVHEYPTIGLSNLQTLICGDAKATTVNITSSVIDYSLVSVDGKAIVSGLNVTVPVDGVYPMKYTANHQYCPGIEDFNLSFFKNPDGVLKVSGQMEGQKCFGYNLDAIFTPEGDLARANYEWEFGGEIIANGIGLITQVVPLGVSHSKRDLKLIVSQDGCSSSYIQPDILVIPDLDFKVDKNIGCEPLDVVFTALSDGAITYDWDFGDENIFKGSTPDQLHTYQDSGFYDVKIKVTTGDDCSNEVIIPKMVHVAPIPDVKFSISSEDCLEPGVNQISYSGIIGNVRDRYLWDTSQFDPSEIIQEPGESQGPFIFDLKTKPKTILGLKVISEFGCESVPGSIVLKRKPDFSMESIVNIDCVPFVSELTGIVNVGFDVVDFSWDFGDGTNDTGSPITHTYIKPGKGYTVTLTGISSVTGCENVVVEPDFLKTHPKPDAAFSMDHSTVYNDNPMVNFSNSSTGANAYLWNFGDEMTSVTKEPSHFYAVAGYRTVILEAFNEFLCSDTVSHQLLVAFNRLFPPTGFSPNATNAEDREFILWAEGISTTGYHLVIQSRWNDIVFETRDEIKGWDGKMRNGTFAPTGVYVWVLNYSDFLGQRHRQTGTVTLVY